MDAIKARRSRLASINPLISYVNVYSPPSTPTSSENFTVTGTRRSSITLDHNRRIINDIIDNIFDEKTGICEVSSSSCASLQNKCSEYSFDKRLKYWKEMLEERKDIAAQIKRKTGKMSHSLLFNEVSTLHERDKHTVQRLMDYAERMNPFKVRNIQQAKLKQSIDPETCMLINELQATLPKAEREQSKSVEITGLPGVAKLEILGSKQAGKQKPKSEWLQSKVLEHRIEERRDDIARVIEYYPNIEHLQIVGKSLTKKHVCRRNPEVALLSEEQITHVSSDSAICDSEHKRDTAKLLTHSVEYGLKINELLFQLPHKRSSRNVEIETNFECEPFEKQLKRVLHLQNVGMKVLNFEWCRRAYYDKSAKLLLKPQDDEFFFDTKSFRLIPGEMRGIVIQFQPRKVAVSKEKWILKIEPLFFCRRADGIVLKLSGKCKPSLEYSKKLKDIQDTVIGKSNTHAMLRLTTHLATLTPLIHTYDTLCPYKRPLTEPELFEIYNTGYKCVRYHELEMLKDIYARAKKPREPLWDLKIETLRATILKLDRAEQRALLFGEMMQILQEMHGAPVELEEKLIHNTECEHARLVYVRGVITAGIDEWEEITLHLEESFFKSAMQEYFDQLLITNEEQQEENASEYEEIQETFNEEQLRSMLVKRVRHQKTFRDAFYIQTYTLVCNFIEDIVSVIESTEII